jgi:hypothetical protein
METFPIVKRKDEAAHGEYRTKRVMLEIYDQMASAAETGQPYQTLLDPPPAELDLAVSDPATVTSLHPREERPYLRPEEAQPASVAAEEKAPYDAGVKEDATNLSSEQPQYPTDTTPEIPLSPRASTASARMSPPPIRAPTPHPTRPSSPTTRSRRRTRYRASRKPRSPSMPASPTARKSSESDSSSTPLES